MDIVVGTAGHIDHGKTALVKALTGVDADRLPEEKSRGITIDIGFAELRLGDHHISFVDVPGHERFVKNMLAGASGIDLVLLVVAADEGVMPQTREHFEICRLLGIRSGIIALTKSDLADAETIELARLEAQDLVKGSFLAGAALIPVSSRTREGVEDLRKALTEAALKVTARSKDLEVHLPVDRSFAVKGFGTVVTGTLSSGEVRVGDDLELLPSRRRVRVRGLQSHSSTTETALAGRRVAVNLGGIDHDEVSRGELLSTIGVLRPSQILDTQIELLPGSSRPLRSRQRVRVHIGTSEVLARVQVLNDAAELVQGEREFVQLRLELPIAARLRDHFILRSYSPQTTIAGGTVLDPLAAKLRKREFTARRELLAKLSDPAAPKDAVVLAFVEGSGDHGISIHDIAARTGWRVPVLRTAIETLVTHGSLVLCGDTAISTRRFNAVQSELLRMLETHHKRDRLSKGMSREILRPRGMSASVFDAVAADLKRQGKIDLRGDTVSLAAVGTDLSREDQLIRTRILQRLKDAGLQVPRIDALLTEAVAGTKAGPSHAKKILFLLFDSGEVVKISEEFVFLHSIIDGLITKLRDHAARGDRTIDVTKFKDMAGASRKYAIPLLEYFDREKVTLRTGDKRVIR